MPRRVLSNAQAAAMRARFADGGGKRGLIAQLARECGVSPDVARATVRGKTYREPASDPRVRRWVKPALTPEQRAELVRRYAAGDDQAVIAADLDITPSYVARLARRALGVPHKTRPPRPHPPGGYLRCTACGVERPTEDFSKSATRRSGRNGRCRLCVADLYTDWQARAAMTVTVTEKHCWRCDRVKLAEEFYRNRTRRDGLSTACRLCSIAIALERQRRATAQAPKRG